jgi:hypothetical protein
MSSEPLDGLIAADRSDVHESSYIGQLFDVLESGYRKVFIVWLSRSLSAAKTSRLAAAISVLLVATWPYVVDLLLLVVAPSQTLRGGQELMWTGSVTLTALLMLAFAWSAWSYAKRLVVPLGQLLGDSPQRGELLVWLRRRMSFGWQLLSSLCGVAIACALVVFTSLQPTSSMESTVALYVHAGWSGFLGGNALYWLITFADLPLRIRHFSGLRFSWIDPARTPAMVHLCRCYALVSAAMGVGLIGTELTGVILAAQNPGMALSLFIISFPVVGAGIALYVGVQPYVTLARIVRHHLDDILLPLLEPDTHAHDSWVRLNKSEEQLKAYSYYSSLPALPIKTANILQYVAGILASLIVFFFQQSLS